MEKYVEPLVTNSEEEVSFVRSVATIIIGGIAIAGLVAGLKSCENSFDKMQQSSVVEINN